MSQLDVSNVTIADTTKSQKSDASTNQPRKMDMSQISDGIYRIKLINDAKRRNKLTYIAQLTLLSRNG